MAKSNGGFFRRAVRGEYGLARTYWLIFSLPIGPIVAIAALLGFLAQEKLVFLLLTAVVATWVVFCAVAVDRASKHYHGQQFWAILARLQVLLSSAIVLVGVVLAIVLAI